MKPTRADLVDILAEADGQEIAAMDPVTKDRMYGELAQTILDRIDPPSCRICGGRGYLFQPVVINSVWLAGMTSIPCPKGCQMPIFADSTSTSGATDVRLTMKP